MDIGTKWPKRYCGDIFTVTQQASSDAGPHGPYKTDRAPDGSRRAARFRSVQAETAKRLLLCPLMVMGETFTLSSSLSRSLPPLSRRTQGQRRVSTDKATESRPESTRNSPRSPSLLCGWGVAPPREKHQLCTSIKQTRIYTLDMAHPRTPTLAPPHPDPPLRMTLHH